MKIKLYSSGICAGMNQWFSNCNASNLIKCAKTYADGKLSIHIADYTTEVALSGIRRKQKKKNS